jgi:hypothetical protein
MRRYNVEVDLREGGNCTELTCRPGSSSYIVWSSVRHLESPPWHPLSELHLIQTPQDVSAVASTPVHSLLIVTLPLSVLFL